MKAAIAGLVLCALLGGCASLMPGREEPKAPEVALAQGTLEGVRAGGIESFKGIPFAAPPVGPLRWRPPQPAPPWSGVRDASAFGDDCMQVPSPGDATPARTALSENCLYLNVWRPAGAAKLPVMVWIYGGGFVNGASSAAVFDGTRFAKDHLVFVSFNYRLGRFGYFAFPALTAEHPDEPKANYGMMDQIAALKWVKANIAAFGGDPDNVTVFGESAGGMSVHMLLASPAAKGLFQRAMIESGGGRSNIMWTRDLAKDQPGAPSEEAAGVAFANSVGIDGTDAAALAALRALPAAKIAGDLNMEALFMGHDTTTYGGPCIDGTLLPEPPEAIYAAGHEAPVPLLIGANSDDLGFFAATSKDAAFASFGSRAAGARRVYDPDGTKTLPQIVREIGMDSFMLEPARNTARAFARDGLDPYEYRFSYVAPAAAAYMPDGAQHFSEVPYVFETLPAIYGTRVQAGDEAVAAQVHAYWVNFARSGNPNGPGLPAWPAYAPAKDVLMNFTQQGPQAMADPLKARLDATAAHADLAPQI